MRLCCQGMSSTTPAPYFPKECGKQLYTPLGQRIIGGSVVQPHSWPKQVYTVTVGLHDIVGVHFMEQKISAEKIYVQEEYNSVKLSNDIAVIYLSKSVKVTDKINFICLPGPEASIGEKVYVLGWGKTSVNGDISAVLKQIDLNVMSCRGFLASSKYDTQKQMCAATAEAG
ncbi:unnamed protein product [Rotaria sp. Silwood1]|nr:unnamed protein product [Rotaria sp. Silwood1]CAF4735862.1 unnamed protein product [Rotaria sp. Silwood1]